MRQHSFLCFAAERHGARSEAMSCVRRQGQALGLEPVLDLPELIFLGTAGARQLPLPKALGLIWGSLFESPDRPVRVVESTTACGWIGSNGEDLARRYWGGYLAVLKKGNNWIFARDPSGSVPCYYTKVDGGLLLSSDADLAARTGLLSGRFDWDEVASQLRFFSRRSTHTALHGFNELMPGCALDFGAGAIETRLIWSPYAFTEPNERVTDFSRAVPLVRARVGTTIAAWSSLFPRPLVELSGGLDSSIVAACLAKAGAEATCLAFRGGGADLDETHYAKAVADRAGLPFVDATLAISDIDILQSAAAHLPRPTARSFAMASDRQSLSMGRRLHSGAFFTGTGGDNVFWYFNTATPAIDRLRVDGPIAAMTTLTELAEMCGVSRATAGRIALRRLLRRRRIWPEDATFLAQQAIQSPSAHEHPWLPAAAAALPGTYAYVQALIQMQDQLEAFDRIALAPLVAPLLSQPVVEQCLQTASWLWCRDGRNRAVARTAFCDLLPKEIIARQTKGGFEGFSYELLEANRARALEMLLDGLLASRGLLDKAELEAALGSGRPVSFRIAHRLMRLVAVEAWLGTWRVRGWR